MAEPATIESGGPVHVSMSPTLAAGIPAIIIVTVPGGITGPPTCGTVPFTNGQTCISPTLAANGMIILLRLIQIYDTAFYIRSSSA